MLDPDATLPDDPRRRKRPTCRRSGNEPPTDFARDESRRAMRQAIDEVRGRLGRQYLLIIDGQDVDTPAQRAPSSPSLDPRAQLEGRRRDLDGHRRARRTRKDRRRAGRPSRRGAELARTRAAPQFSFGTAEILRSRRALNWPPGKPSSAASPWPRPMATSPRPSTSRVLRPERSSGAVGAPLSRRPRGDQRHRASSHGGGIAVIIPPWNFPLAIPTGMTVAAAGRRQRGQGCSSRPSNRR